MDTPNPIRETSDGTDLALAVLAGLGAAIVAGVVWAYIVKISDYEVGVVAWAIGFVTGTAVVYATRQRKAPAFAVVAVVAALIGILLGKYLSFVFIARDELESLGADVPIFSSDTWHLFMDNKDIVFSFWDLLWIGLALATAWRVAKPEAPQPLAEGPPSDGPPPSEFQ